MRYKVNFHVLLYFLSSCSTMMASQVPNRLNEGDSKTSSSNNNTTTNSTNDTKEVNTFLINVHNSNHSSNDFNVDDDDDTSNKATLQRTTHLASTNDRIATALATNHTKIQTSKFLMLINWHSKSKMLIITK